MGFSTLSIDQLAGCTVESFAAMQLYPAAAAYHQYYQV
jgi:hypothetical protein